MGLARAFGALVTDRLGFTTYADESTNSELVFPCIEVGIANGDEVPAGMGGKLSHYEKSAGVIVKRVRQMRGEAVIRFTIRASGTSERSSEAQCVYMTKTLMDDLRLVKYGDEIIQIIDPVTSENQGVFGIDVGFPTQPSVNTQHEPITHDAILDLTIRYRYELKSPVIVRIEKAKTTIDHEVL